jgi:dihydroorotate dehydrogenase
MVHFWACVESSLVKETGGLSGKPVFALTLQRIKQLHSITQGKIPLIACGGISSSNEAQQYLAAGASLVQLYSSLTYRGPGVVADIKQGLSKQRHQST